MSKYRNYLDRLYRLDQTQIYKKHTQFNTYQDYLHQNINRRTHKRRQPSARLLTTHIKNTIVPSHPTSTIEYYPMQRTIIDYQDRKFKELTPKKKIVTEYIKKKHVEIVPKEVVVKDYYAVQYIRGYIKEIVPEVKVEYAPVKKVIKKQEMIPHQKQIIYYPPHLTNLDQIKREAQQHLSRNGVTIRADAEYRPAIAAFRTENVKSSQILSQKQKGDNGMSSVTFRSPLSPSVSKQKYYRLPRPNRPNLAASRSLDKSTKYALPIYKQDIQTECATQEGRSRHNTDYSFAEREGSMKMSSSFNKNP